MLTSHLIDNRADGAQRRAKELGKDRVIVYGDTSNSADKLYQLELDILEAVKNKEFILYFQPIVRLLTGETEGYEALVRWDSNRGVIGPDKFIPTLENSGRLHLLSKQIFEMAADAQSKTERWISVNVSPITLDRDDFQSIIQPILRCDVQGHFEITERLQLSLKARNEIDFLQKMGWEISLDDFGTGTSRYQELHRVNLLKVDKSLVDDIHQNDKAFRICSAIVSMAKSLGLKVIAEGVEVQEQKEALEIMKCDYAQGFLFGKPMPIDQKKEG